MNVLPEELYRLWRQQLQLTSTLKDSETETPPERLLQQIWQHQRLQSHRLETSDGSKIQVLHPGFWNREAGPDFKHAVIKIGAQAPSACDVEIDLQPQGWLAHRHHQNPAFEQVGLHVVWEGKPTAACPMPHLALSHQLDTPIAELTTYFSNESLHEFPERLLGKCASPLKNLPQATVSELLHQAALVRLQRKGQHLRARAKLLGWEQALWEGLFGGLGYKHNAWPMRRLAEIALQFLHRDANKGSPLAIEDMQAFLLGVSGFLPLDVSRQRQSVDRYVRRTWDYWWRERATFSEIELPPAIWRMHGIRPANHPTRRIALAAHWLVAGDLVKRLESWFQGAQSSDNFASKLLATLLPKRDRFWSNHWTFKSAAHVQPKPLLGQTRCTDLAINTIVPWFWIRAVVGKNDRLRDKAELLYFKWPKAEDNAVLKLARQRLFSRVPRKLFRTAATQQGLLQIVNDFCNQSNAICDDCAFPDLIRSIRTSDSGMENPQKATKFDRR